MLQLRVRRVLRSLYRIGQKSLRRLGSVKLLLLSGYSNF